MLTYHLACAYQRSEMGGHLLDWLHQPAPFKTYRERDSLPLAQPAWPWGAFFDLALGQAQPAPAARPLDAAALSSILLLAAGVTAINGQGPQAMHLRAPASAGALYPAELYCAACGVEGLEDGLYHFAPAAPGLTPLWPGPLAAEAARLLGGEPAQLTFFISAMFWRSLWKYRTRAWRYCLLDAGHMLANLELACLAWGLEPRPCINFRDNALAVFLGLVRQEETALAALSAGPPPAEPGPAQAGLPPLDRQALPLSQRQGRDPALAEAVAAGDLEEPAPSPRWLAPGPPDQACFFLEPPQAGGPELASVIAERRSRRNFIPQALGAGQLPRLLAAALPQDGPVLATVLVGTNQEVDPGAYLYLPSSHCLVPQASNGDRRWEVASACLGQMWVGQASLVLVLWADLERLEELAGPRAYRHVMLAAGRAGQRLYLAATALSLGCCGVGAFYDSELAEAAGLPPRAQPLYVLAAGPVKGPVPGLA